MRRDLNHPATSRYARSRELHSGVVPLHRTRIRGPAPDSNSITYSSLGTPALLTSSTNAGGVLRREGDVTPEFLRIEIRLCGGMPLNRFFNCRLPQRLRRLRPSRLRAAELLELLP